MPQMRARALPWPFRGARGYLINVSVSKSDRERQALCAAIAIRRAIARSGDQRFEFRRNQEHARARDGLRWSHFSPAGRLLQQSGFRRMIQQDEQNEILMDEELMGRHSIALTFSGLVFFPGRPVFENFRPGQRVQRN